MHFLRTGLGSGCFGVLYEDKQIGFARAIMDKATFAYLADVYVLAEHRGKGISLRLMEHASRNKRTHRNAENAHQLWFHI